MGSHQVLLEPLYRLDPERIGSYVLLGRLGAGAMGRVYLGRSPAGRLVAIKTIRPEYADEADFRARFAREVAAARRVSGAFTAAVVAADPDADVPWLATAYVPAPSLDHLVQTCGPLPVPAVRWLAAGCAEALESIHDAGLIHRDLKPSNVLVAPDGPRVIDFGVARVVERISLTRTHGSVGTPAYMAPEQARDTRQAIVASDAFSLGSTLLFAATGHAPYQGETVMDILVRLATEPPDLSGLPGELTDIVAPCLERDPRRRPTPTALLGELAPYMDAAAAHELGPSLLPTSALALIEEYRQQPQPQARMTDSINGDVTFGSQAFGSASASPGPHRFAIAPPPAALGSAPRRGLGGVAARARSSLSRAWRAGKLASVVLSVGAAVALVVLGVLLGAWIDSSGNAPQDTRLGGPPPGRNPPPPLSGASDRPTGNPEVVVNQPMGDGDTVFVVHGRGWVPGSRITLRLVGRPPSGEMPVVDQAGTFNYAINQQHEFFSGALPPGNYTVVATTSAGVKRETTFHVGP